MLSVWCKKCLLNLIVSSDWTAFKYIFNILLLHGTPCPNSPRTRPMMSQITIYYLFFSDWITLLFLKLTLLAVESFRRLWYPGELGVEWSDRSGRMGTESLPPQSRPPRSEADVPPLGMVGPMVSMLVKLLLRPWKKSTKYIITICFVLCTAKLVKTVLVNHN